MCHTHVEICIRRLFVSMKVVINDKNNICILQTTSKTLFCYSSLVVEIFQQCNHTESCVRNFFTPMKYVINEKNNLSIPQRARQTSFYCCLCVVKISANWTFGKLYQKHFFPLNNCLKSIGSLENIKLLKVNSFLVTLSISLITFHLNSFRP